MHSDQLLNFLLQWQHSPWLPLLIVCSYIIGVLIFIPIPVLVLATALMLPPLQAVVCAESGIVLSGLTGLLIGRTLGEKLIGRLSSDIVDRVRRRLSGNEIISVTLLRKLPVAPFNLVNMALGALHVRASYFIFGTILGTAPLVILVTVLDSSIETITNENKPELYALVIPIWIATILLALLIQRMIRQRSSPTD